MTLFLIILQWLLPLTQAQVYSPQGQEVNFSTQYTLKTELRTESDIRYEIERQISHLFGVFQSPDKIREFGLDPLLIGGIGAIQFPLKIDISRIERAKDGERLVLYSVHGKMLLHKLVAKKILSGSGDLIVPLPLTLKNFYDISCTDSHYSSQGDFWYFFDPFKKGCEYLGKSPMAQPVTLKITLSAKRKLNLDVRLDLLRGNNGNGEKFQIDVIHGFEESSSASNDVGRLGHNKFLKLMRAQNFVERPLQKFKNRPLTQFTKWIRLRSGEKIEVVVRALLVGTTIDAKTTTFAKFFRESVREADVIYYAGHSGLGGNLDVPSLEEKAGGFEFNHNKRQIFFFNSCSSYSYYLDSFRSEKTRAKIDVVTNGLSAYFDTFESTLGTFLRLLTNPNIDDLTWPEMLSEMERPLDGQSFLLNVGGI